MRRLLTLLLTLCLLGSLTACGPREPLPEEPPATEPSAPEVPADPDAGYTVYDCGGIRIALPTEYLDQLIVDMDFPDAQDSWKPLMSVYEKASVEAAEADWGDGMGTGFLFGVLSMDQAGYERLLCEDLPGIDVFAAKGERYYAYTYPTDVQFYRSGGVIDTESEDWKNWESLNELGPAVRADMVERNGLTPFDTGDFYSEPFTFEGAHAYLKYYSYFTFDGDIRLYDTLVLSQPAKQGEGGIWCVERFYDVVGSCYLWFPDSGMAAMDYYAQLQAACDAGELPELLTLTGAAKAFVKEWFGHETAEGSFAETGAFPKSYMEQNSRLQDLASDLVSGRTVDPMDLLDCVGGVDGDNWGVLGRRMYGSDWFTPLMAAVENAAVGTEQQRRDGAVMSFFLAARDARTDFRTPLSAVLQTQREADGAAFAAALGSFSTEEQAVLNAALET